MPRITIVDTDANTIGDCSCCGFRSPKKAGHQRKCAWLRKQYPHGLRYKILQVDGRDAGMIEYAPGEHAWRPVEAEGYMVIHCILVHTKAGGGKGYGTLLLDECLKDAKQARLHGVVAVASGGTWMADERLFVRHGFECVDTAPPSFKLMVKKFHEAPDPSFVQNREQTLRKHGSGLVIFTSDQCPYVAKGLSDILELCAQRGLEPKVVEMKTSREARQAPSPYGVFNIAYNGKIVAEHPIRGGRFRYILRELGLEI